ncbi:hypothetical protein EVAR_12265_1 [Eumeta japonica]|uniref:Uncharacterized protein n=1 Tax=Eumeta variegata TaxID=151549 RepID=A0A4C1TU58_EUMVA|nr:hypothetical protein EVAR_12265_1 [Eumeta japonica]
MQAPKRNRSARHEPVYAYLSHSLSLALSLSLLGGLTVLEWKGRVPLTLSHCERITLCATAVFLLLKRIGRWSGKGMARSAFSLARLAHAERDNALSCVPPAFVDL